MNVPSLILLGRSSVTRNELAKDLDCLKDDFPDLQIVKLDLSLLSAVNRTSQLVVIDLENWQPSDELVINDLRNQGYEGPIVVLTTRVDEATSNSYTSEKILFFDRGKGVEELRGVTRRMLLGSLIASRRHPRHPTNEKAELQLENQRDTFACSVRNLSAGGAFIEFERVVLLRVGATVSLRIHLPRVGRIHSVKARVAWIKGTGIGVEFLPLQPA